MTLKIASLPAKDTRADAFSMFRIEDASCAALFHKTFPQYQATPLVELKKLARHLGIDALYVKDESFRFGLNAFKVLGGSFAMGNAIAQKLGLSLQDLPFEKLISEEVREKLGEVTFVTATDGNHGRGVAWTAHQLKQHAIVFMPKGTAEERIENIRTLGADVHVLDCNYDDCVRYATHLAKENNYIIVQDTAWKGYEEIPLWIMQGYTTIACELIEQLPKQPTHIVLQAGVGSMAGAMAAFFANVYDAVPEIIIVEPNKADCFYQTASANDGNLHPVTGDLDSIMAGLCCGEPCSVAWEILSSLAVHYVSMPDYIAAHGMRVLGNPLEDDPRIISGESGAAGIGFAIETLCNEALADIRSRLSLDKNSRILCISTEGDTDKKNYRRIVWDGLTPE